MIEVIEDIRYNKNTGVKPALNLKTFWFAGMIRLSGKAQNNRIQERGEGMEDRKTNGLEALEKASEFSGFKWYIFDMIHEGLEQDGIEKSQFSLDKEEPAAVCFLVGDGSLMVCGKAGEDSRQHDDFYHAVCDFFNRIYEDEEKAENAVTRFLIRTLDLPALMKMPSRSMLKDQICRCREEINDLEEKIKKEPLKKSEAMLSLNRIYLKGLNEKLKKHYGETE